MPCASHFSGNTDATFWSQLGRSLKTKNTPEMNWSTINGPTTTADALFADFGTDENAMPSTALAAVPST